jgi:hypothetical protein
MGQALLQKTQLSEATEYLELAISKVRISGPLLFPVFLRISPFCSLEVKRMWWFNIYHSLFCMFHLSTYLFLFVFANVSSWFFLLIDSCSKIKSV